MEPLIPCFGLLVMFPLGFKTRVGSLIVMVHGCPPHSPWLRGDGHQARRALVTNAALPHLLVNSLQMAAPRVAIWIPPSNGVSACTDAMHARPTKNFYKRGVRHTSGLTFSQL